MGFLDINNLKLNLKIYIENKSVTTNKKIRINQEKKRIIPTIIKLPINLCIYFIIKLPINHNNKILYFFEIYETNFIIIFQK